MSTTITIDSTTTWEQFKDMVLDLRKQTRGQLLKMAEVKAGLLLEVEQARGADKKETRIWSSFVRDVFRSKAMKIKGLEGKTNLTLPSEFKKKLEGGPSDSFVGIPLKLTQAQDLLSKL